ncbi:unnamed protein product [Laminaria digitata]
MICMRVHFLFVWMQRQQCGVRCNCYFKACALPRTATNRGVRPVRTTIFSLQNCALYDLYARAFCFYFPGCNDSEVRFYRFRPICIVFVINTAILGVFFYGCIVIGA